MKNSKLFKGLALLNFVGLLVAFLLYRNGSFENRFSKTASNEFTSSNGGVATKQSTDSIASKKKSLEESRLSSSKSMIIIDKFKFKADSIKPKKDLKKNKDIRIMSSSKSAIIIEPTFFLKDSSLIKKIEKDKVKKKK